MRTPFRRTTPALMIASLAVGALGLSAASAAALGFGTERVGRLPGGAVLTPDNERLTPAGHQIEVAGRLVSSTLSPNGRFVAALTWQNFTGYLSITDLKTGKIAQYLPASREAATTHLGDGTVSFDGPLYSKSGDTLWVPQSQDVVRLNVAADGTVSNPVIVPTPASDPKNTGGAIPSGMALSPDGLRLYVALNGNNTLGVIDTITNKLIRQIPVGLAPRQVVLDGPTAYVSNQGGRPATGKDFTNLSYGTSIPADPKTGGARTGTVSVVNLARGAEERQIAVGLQPTALLLHGSALFVTNSNDDSLSIIDTPTRRVVQTANVNPFAARPVGSSPNALAVVDGGGHLLVSLGRSNAIVEFGFDGARKPLRMEGLIPTGWYPVAMQVDPALEGKIVVTNDKGVGALGPLHTITQGVGTKPAVGHNAYSDVGTYSLFAPPDVKQLRSYTKQVVDNNLWTARELKGHGGDMATATGPDVAGAAGAGDASAAGDAAAGAADMATGAPDNADSARRLRAIPAHMGEPSAIKHVFLIVKENRTYDQVFGDIKGANGDPSLTQFGEKVTPNQHKLVHDFTLLDNLYAGGTLSADGHNWLVQADANDYIEKEFGNFARSYPASGADALAYQRTGFLWDAAQAAGKSVRSWGEYANFFAPTDPKFAKSMGTWQDWFNDSLILEGKKQGNLHVPVGAFQTRSDVPSLDKILQKNYPNFQLTIPDQYRADLFGKDLAGYDKNGGLPNLNLLWVMADHTSGSAPGFPTPAAQVADNDLAVGRIVDGISHTRFWKDSAIFVIEDDAQDGADHVDGHRTSVSVAGPYVRRGAMVDTYYSQINLVRTIEQILGMRPMNQLDEAAVPMRDVFTDKPNFAPYNVVENQVPLDAMTPPPAQAAAGPSAQSVTPAGQPAAQARTSPPTSADMTNGASGGPTPEEAADAWSKWSGAQGFGDRTSGPDRSDEHLLNRAVWYAGHDWSVPYPGDSQVLLPSQVPGAHLLPAAGGED